MNKFILAILFLVAINFGAFGQAGIRRQPLTTNEHFGPLPSEGQVPIWNAVAGKWSNNVITVSGGTTFADLVWTNKSGTILPNAFPTNILLRIVVPDDGVGTNFYFDARTFRTNAASKIFQIYNGGSNALTIGPNGGLFSGRGNATPFPGAVLYGIFDQALGETNQQEVFILSKNSTVGYNGAADILVDTNYGAFILTANKEGGTKFTRFAVQAGAGINPENFNTFSMQALVDGAAYFQVDPSFTLLQPTNYLFSSSVRITNIHTLMSLQNSNFPVLEVDGVGDLRLIKKVPYIWPSAQGAASTALTNDGTGGLGWWPISVGGGSLTTNENQFLGVPLSIKSGALLTNTLTRNGTNTIRLNLVGGTPISWPSINIEEQVPSGDSLLINAIYTTFKGSLTVPTNLSLQSGEPNTAAGKVWTATNSSGFGTWSNAPTAALTTNANQFGAQVTLTIKDAALLTNIHHHGSLEVSNSPGWAGRVRLWQTNGLGYTELMGRTNQWQPTNRFIFSITNPVAGQIFKFSDVSIADGIASIVITNDADNSGGGGITTNGNQFGESTTITIKDTALLTNLANFKILFLTNAPGDGSPIITLSQTNGVGYSQITIPDDLRATNRFILSIGSNTVSATQVLKVHSTSISGGINTIILTNDADAGGGSVTFSDLVWTNNTGNLYPVAFPTNIIFNPTNAGVGSGGLSRTKTNFVFHTSERRIGGTNQLFMILNGGASAFTVGDQGIMIGSTNYIPVPQAAIDIAYDLAFGVDTPQKSILMTSYHSGVGYSGNAFTTVSTNYGEFQLNANRDGNGFIQITETVGQSADWKNYNLQLLVQDQGNTLIFPYQIDPDFSLSPTGYIFGSTERITNIHTLISLQNSNTPMFEVNGIGDLKLLKRIPYSWPSAQGASSTALTNDGSGNLGWWPISVGGGGGLTTNANQFGAQVTLTIKEGALLTNTLFYPSNLTGPAVIQLASVGQGTNLTEWRSTNGVIGLAISSNGLAMVQQRLDLANTIAFRTNQLDFKLNTYQAFTNALRTNLVMQLTNTLEGVTTRLDAYGAGRLGNGITNAWNILCTAPSGVTIYWPPGTTNGNFDVLVNSNQVVSFTFMGGLGSTNILASYRVLEGIGAN